MNKIKITIKAFGLIGDDYDGKEIQQEKIVNINSSYKDLTQEDLKQILKTLIASVKEIKVLYPDEQTDVISHNDNRLFSIKFEITSIDSTGSCLLLEEKSFFELVAKHNSLAPLILDYCKVTDDGEEGSRVMITHEYDEGPPAGTYAILALVNQDKKWITHYIEFLRTNDLDHEVEQMWHIKAIIDKYGWCKETYELAIARKVTCCGQGGKTQFKLLVNDGLKESLNENRNREIFLVSVLKEFQEWMTLESMVKNRSKDRSRDFIINNMALYLKDFEEIVLPNEIANIESILLEKMNDYF